MAKSLMRQSRFIDVLHNRKRNQRNFNQSLAQVMTNHERDVFSRMVLTDSCEYGHFECSIQYAGPCNNEVQGIRETKGIN